jgi:uncharacterized protein
MKELIQFIASRLVDRPDEIAITVQEGDDTVTIELKVAQDDLGKVIGKQGRTARAMRAVLAAAQTEGDKRIRLEIAE